MNNKSVANQKLKDAYNLYYSNLQRLCNIKLKDEYIAEDCVQECFLILYKRYLNGAEIVNVGGFLYKIADNLIKTEWRKKQKEQNIVPLDSVADTLASNEVEIFDLDYDSISQKLLSQLSEKEYELYKLKYIDEKTIKEISIEMNLSFEAIAKRLSRLRQKIKDIIKIELEGGT